MAKDLKAVNRTNHKSLAADVESARSTFEQLQNEAKRAAKRRDVAKRHLNELSGYLRAIEPKYQKARARFEKNEEKALAARCGDLKRVPADLQPILAHLAKKQRELDLQQDVDTAIERIKAAETFEAALGVAGISVQSTIPSEREREWRAQHGDGRVRLLATWMAKVTKGRNTKLQEAIMEIARQR